MDRTIQYFQDRTDMDRTIHYFQDRTEYGSYDSIFPGYEEVEKLRFPIFPGFWRMLQTSISIFPGEQ